MAGANEIKEKIKQGAEEASDRAKEANDEIRRTARKVADRSPIKLDVGELERFADERPLTLMAVAGVAGFVMGGGLRTKLGLTLLAIFGRRAARQSAANLASDWWRRTPRPRMMQSGQRFGFAARAR